MALKTVKLLIITGHGEYVCKGLPGKYAQP